MAEQTFKHGLWAYRHHNCKCDICTQANTDAQARYRPRMKESTKAKQRASNSRYKARKTARAAVQKRCDSAVPDDWTW